MTASTGLRFEVLGPVQVTHGERQWPVRSRRQRAILTVLLLNRGRTVGLDTLAEAAWAARRRRRPATRSRSASPRSASH